MPDSWTPGNTIETRVVVEPRLRSGNRLLKDTVAWASGVGCPLVGGCWPKMQYRVYWGASQHESVTIDPLTGDSTSPANHPNIRVHNGVAIMCDGAVLSHRKALTSGGCVAQVTYGFDVRERVNGQCVSKYMVRQVNPAGELQGRAYGFCPGGQIYAYDGSANDTDWHDVGCAAIEYYPYKAQ